MNYLHVHIILAVKADAVFINSHFPHGSHEAQSDQLSYPRDLVAKLESEPKTLLIFNQEFVF